MYTTALFSRQLGQERLRAIPSRTFDLSALLSSTRFAFVTIDSSWNCFPISNGTRDCKLFLDQFSSLHSERSLSPDYARFSKTPNPIQATSHPFIPKASQAIFEGLVQSTNAIRFLSWCSRTRWITINRARPLCRYAGSTKRVPILPSRWMKQYPTRVSFLPESRMAIENLRRVRRYASD